MLVGGPGFGVDDEILSSSRSATPLDFWRVEAFEQERLLRLRAEMRVPGRAWLQFEVSAGDGARLDDPPDRHLRSVGNVGLVYWYALWPFHGYIFGVRLRNIVAAAHDARAPADVRR